MNTTDCSDRRSRKLYEREKGRTSMRHRHSSYLFILLLAGVPIVCCGQRKETEKPAYCEFPAGNLLHSLKGEQWDVVLQYGIPDRAFQGPLGITRWIYCNRQGKEVTIEFDSKGGMLLKQIGEDIRLCPVKRPAQHI